MSDTPQLAKPGDESGFAFARFVSLLGVTPNAVGTFFPTDAPSLEVAWDVWAESYFSPILAPAFVSTFQEAMASRADEIGDIDRALEKNLPEEMAHRSRKASEPFFEGKDEMKANRVWTRYATSVANGETPGNLPVVFALQAALFQLPLPSALGAYAWFELRSREAETSQKQANEEEKRIFSRILPKVTVAVAGKFGEFNGDSGPLRTV